MDPHLQFVLLSILLLCCLIRDNSFGSRCVVVDFERPAAVSITRQGSDGAEIWGYVEVRKGAYLFWSYYKSPHRVSSPEKPWPTAFYAAPDASLGHDNSTWLHNADLLVVDTPVGTGNSYEDDASSSGNGVWSMAQTTFPLLRGAFLQAAADILVLLRAPTLAGSAPSSD
ncbi:unnamed protein product [Miscanthus lutarioriparius]|uniref:Uncharacterized protein n=1 Tax=Miscanthus lutarioriparius TaxID=422564 RepID=A0A811SUB2_9POAL|nr:unnamed protein product [Miscanthus lutarioriparius]